MYKEYQKDIIMKNIGRKPYTSTKIEKIIIHYNYNRAIKNKNEIYPAIYAITQMVGQTPKLEKEKESRANFKVRKNMEIRGRVTIREKKGENIIKVIMMKIKEWNEGNYNREGNKGMGIRDIGTIEGTKIERTTGVGMNIVIKGGEKREREILMSYYGMEIHNNEKCRENIR